MFHVVGCRGLARSQTIERPTQANDAWVGHPPSFNQFTFSLQDTGRLKNPLGLPRPARQSAAHQGNSPMYFRVFTSALSLAADS